MTPVVLCIIIHTICHLSAGTCVGGSKQGAAHALICHERFVVLWTYITLVVKYTRHYVGNTHGALQGQRDEVVCHEIFQRHDRDAQLNVSDGQGEGGQNLKTLGRARGFGCVAGEAWVIECAGMQKLRGGRWGGSEVLR